VNEVPNVLEVKDLVVHFPGRHGAVVKAVDGVSFEIARGEILALVGESGCGKSTIAMSVMRLIEPTSGTIISGGENVTSLRGKALRHARRRVQMIFQDPFGSLDARQTVFESVVEPLKIHGVGSSSAERRSKVLDALDFAHLRPPQRLAEVYPHELSGGQRQRVAIASAIVLEPELIVADEPVSMLDVSARTGILRLMVDLRDRLSVSYLFITHDLAVAWVVADRIAVVYLGRIVEIGTSEELVAEPAHPYTKALLSVSGGDDHEGEIDPVTGQVIEVLPGETPSAANVPPGCHFHPRCPRYSELGQPEVCRSADPQLLIMNDRGMRTRNHEVACHFPEEPQ
jgi:oligopeptide/dipeptide ABC transporter ATP-binding protein